MAHSAPCYLLVAHSNQWILQLLLRMNDPRPHHGPLPSGPWTCFLRGMSPLRLRVCMRSSRRDTYSDAEAAHPSYPIMPDECIENVARWDQRSGVCLAQRLEGQLGRHIIELQSIPHRCGASRNPPDYCLAWTLALYQPVALPVRSLD